MRRLVRKLFKPVIVTEEDQRVAYMWVGDDQCSILVDPTTNHVYAMLWNDGDGIIYPTIFVSPFELKRAYAAEEVVSFSLRAFPYCALELFRLTRWTMPAAEGLIEKILEYARII